MNTISVADLILLFMLIGTVTWGVWYGRKVSVRQKGVEAEWVKFKEDRKELYKKLADPKTIEEDMEKGARLREMKDAQRTTLPREDAGPPAVVHRPLLRGAKPGSWRPHNPGSPSKQ